MPPTRRTALVLAALFGAGWAASRLLPAPHAAPTLALDLPSLPPAIARGYRAASPLPDETTDAVRDTLAPGTSIATRTYRTNRLTAIPPALELIRLAGGDRDALHDPRSCLVGVGWRIEGEETRTQSGVSVRVCRLVASDNRPALLVAYTYVTDVQGETYLADPTAVRSRLLFQALLGGTPRPVVFVRCLCRAPAGGDEKMARDSLAACVADYAGEVAKVVIGR